METDLTSADLAEAMKLIAKKFIEVSEGVPGESVWGNRSGFNSFFSRLNSFLLSLMKAIKLPTWIKALLGFR